MGKEQRQTWGQEEESRSLTWDGGGWGSLISSVRLSEGLRRGGVLGGGMGMHTHKVKTGAGLTAAEQTKRRAKVVPWGSLGIIQGWSNIIIRDMFNKKLR